MKKFWAKNKGKMTYKQAMSKARASYTPKTKSKTTTAVGAAAAPKKRRRRRKKKKAE